MAPFTEVSGAILGMLEETVGGLVEASVPAGSAPQDWNLEAVQQAVQRDFNVKVEPQSWAQQNSEIEAAIVPVP